MRPSIAARCSVQDVAHDTSPPLTYSITHYLNLLTAFHLALSRHARHVQLRVEECRGEAEDLVRDRFRLGLGLGLEVGLGLGLGLGSPKASSARSRGAIGRGGDLSRGPSSMDRDEGAW